MIAYVSVGGNTGDVASRIAEAAARVAERLGPVRRSRLYSTAPVGDVADQPRFVNAAFAVTVPDDADPEALLCALQEIERELGRERAREVRQGPRAIDLDLLLVGDMVAATPVLTLPHPRLRERRFVLLPLCDLAGPDLPIAGTAETVGDRLADPMVAAQSVDPL